MSGVRVNHDDEAKNNIRSHVITRTKQSKPNFNVIPIITAMLAFFVSTVNAIPNEIVPFRVNKFESTPGLFFEKTASVRFSYTNCNSIVFVNLNSFFNDAKQMDRNLENLEKLWKNKLANGDSCTSICQLMIVRRYVK